MEFELGGFSDDELVDLARAVAKERDERCDLDPLPWTWPHAVRTMGHEIRRPTGPQNDGRPYPNGTLSILRPRAGYRQDLSAYAHTQTWFPDELAVID